MLKNLYRKPEKTRSKSLLILSAVQDSVNRSPNYIRIVQGMLSIAFDRAVVLGIAKKNPSRMIGNIKSKKTKVDFWTLEEFQKVISLLCKKDYYEHYLFISFWLLFMTGMRIGEASALHWSDIDFETGLLSIIKTGSRFVCILLLRRCENQLRILVITIYNLFFR